MIGFKMEKTNEKENENMSENMENKGNTEEFTAENKNAEKKACKKVKKSVVLKIVGGTIIVGGIGYGIYKLVTTRNAAKAAKAVETAAEIAAEVM